MEVELKGDASSVRTTRLWGFPISVRSELSQETAGSEDPRGGPLATMSLGAPGFPGAKSTVSRMCAVSVCSGHRDNATDRGLRREVTFPQLWRPDTKVKVPAGPVSSEASLLC